MVKNIILIRHGRVVMDWEKKYDSKGFDEAWERYETQPIYPITEHYEVPKDAKVFATKFGRTQETCRGFLGRDDFTVIEDLANEVPLRAFKDTTHKHALWFMNFLGRFQWYFPHWRQEECRRETYARAMKLIDFLESQDTETCVIVMHGFMIRTVQRALSDRGYKVRNKKIFAVPNLCVIPATRKGV